MLDDNGKEIKKTSPCVLKIKISGLNLNTAFQHVEIVTFKKRKIKEIQCEDFAGMLIKGGFNILLDYYSDFARSILLIGDVLDFDAAIRIEDIESFEFVFQK